jgi:hypothetical protein
MKSTVGTELMNRLNTGEFRTVPDEVIEQVRTDICSSIEELLDIGARVRPLYVSGKPQGWVRGVHFSERKQLDRWIHDPYELVVERLLLCTSLTREELMDMNGVELRSLVRLVNEMSESDIRLFPYIRAFVTTSLSEQMWCSRGTEITAYRKREIELPGGHVMQVKAAPDHARLWATLSTHRQEARRRLDESMNSLLIIRPWVGRSADPMANDLRNTAKRLAPDTVEPWQEVVPMDKRKPVDDGWAHGGDDSIESMQRELDGMINNDRHEQLIDRFEKQERERAEKQRAEVEQKIEARGGKGVITSVVKPVTQEQMQSRRNGLKVGRPGMKPEDFEVEQSTADRLAKYR